MPLPRFLRPLTLAILTLVTLPAAAGEILAYTPAGFDALNNAGKAVVVDVYAPWCPTCQAQKPIIQHLAAQPAFHDVTVLTVDFDHDKTALRRFGVFTQSTLIAFHARHEVNRSAGDTAPDGIRGLFEQVAK